MINIDLQTNELLATEICEFIQSSVPSLKIDCLKYLMNKNVTEID